jgi:lysophospholipid acyltransferase (LPLAT)-like uncharacterized protein
MKLRNPWLIKAAGFTLSRLLRSWLGGLRYRQHLVGGADWPWNGVAERYIYVAWHEYLLLPLYLCSHADVCMLLSRHSDGQLLSATLSHFDISQVSGSTSRGGVEALRNLIRVSQRKHIALIPDGPRGPRRRVKPGLIYLAARSGLPIVPAGFGFRRPWRLKSWDQFAVPRPWSHAACIAGPPIRIPHDASRVELADYRNVVEDCLAANTRAAEEWADTGTLQPPSSVFFSTLQRGASFLPQDAEVRESHAAA